MVDEETCRLCGLCCHYQVGDEIRRCKYLKKAGSKYLCRVYRNRLGRTIDIVNGRKYVCIERRHDVRIFPKCPYNKIIDDKYEDKTEN